jgi:hypothetical protein
MLNPYKPGPPIREPHLFFGRQKTMRTILGGLQGVHFAVYGPRRIGKTSLFYHLAETSPALHLNFQTETGDPVKLASRVRQQLRRGRRRFPWLPAGDKGNDPIELLERADEAGRAVVAVILAHTGNHRYLIQWLCYQLWQKSPLPDRWVITPDDLPPVDDLARYFQMDFDYLSPANGPFS